MSRLVALSCPVCGAPFEFDSDQCRYCGAVIFIKPETPRVTKPNLNNAAAQEHIQGFRQRIRADFHDAEAHYGLGVVYYNLGLHDAAVEQLAEAARMMPESPDIQLQLAIVCREMMRSGDDSHYSRCHRAVQNTLMLDPSNVSALTLQTELLVDEGNFDAAIDVVDRLMVIDTAAAEEPRGYIRAARARFHLDSGKWDAANELLTRMDRDSATETLTAFLSAYQPISLYSVGEAALRMSEKRNRNFFTIAVGIIALMVFNQLPEGLFVLLVAGAAIGTFVGLNSRLERNREARRVQINMGTISAARGSMRELSTMARMLSLRFAGQAITDSELEIEEQEISGNQRKQQSGCSGCLWPSR